ncbi:hypothetical protein DWB78_17130 [Halopelagius longus]|uniref:Uncharacterized protein n=1 Tax=Halopelagius longus TaxID=1236180 RepID=A0A370IGN6_9EURY|nr:hypothetical protein DWB78_17130 [Halopelagius longus]
MVDSALVWISIVAVLGAGAVGTSVLHYVREAEFDCISSALGAAAVGYGVELGVANGLLARSRLFDSLMFVCAGIVAVCLVFAVQRGEYSSWSNGGQ